MNSFGGSICALAGGVLYLGLSFALGMEIGSLMVCFLILALVALAVIAALSTVFPNNLFWLYPFIFSLPVSLVGLLALTSGSPSSFAVIGIGTLMVGLIAAYLIRKRQPDI
jgi:hypothetical protein